MNEIDFKKELSIDEIIFHLYDLAQDRESFFTDDGYDDIFRFDYHVLLRAIKLLEKLKAGHSIGASYPPTCIQALTNQH